MDENSCLLTLFFTLLLARGSNSTQLEAQLESHGSLLGFGATKENKRVWLPFLVLSQLHENNDEGLGLGLSSFC